MRKAIFLVSVFFIFALNVSGIEKKTKLVVGATSVPHAEILEKAKIILADKGIDLEIKVFTDYVTPNLALSSKDLDANYFQHKPYLDDFSKEKNLSLSVIGTIHYEPMGLYSLKIKDIKKLKNGDTVAVPNDLTNEARALLLLHDNGIITLKDTANLRATPKDIVSYNVKVKIVEIEAAQIPRSLNSVTAAVINGNYAIEAKLNPAKDALVSESDASLAATTYGNVFVVRQGDEDRAELKEIVKVLKSQEIKDFINGKYRGAVVPAK